MPSLILNGCAPVPIAHYLKALGILRLVSEDSEHGDPRALGCWKGNTFELSSTINREELLNFFLHDYRPTPIINPWNGGSGFYFRDEKTKEKDPVTNKRIKTGVRNEETSATREVTSIAGSTIKRFSAASRSY